MIFNGMSSCCSYERDFHEAMTGNSTKSKGIFPQHTIHRYCHCSQFFFIHWPLRTQFRIINPIFNKVYELVIFTYLIFFVKIFDER